MATHCHAVPGGFPAADPVVNTREIPAREFAAGPGPRENSRTFPAVIHQWGDLVSTFHSGYKESMKNFKMHMDS
jgi:hypothetical protein